ncbi:DUF4271 domain-containing protein [Winogradskyella alexanderae]|uniref:DUF4271 domain-containing protein n=1 Tax=Winogradskyella alexanderae TaxID=2877123 RepID=A0ABS7XR73_9FLAO|nr:DUF4271 domain-containing protein [Winogradskyella alexanderae]MCA0131541.1 DUF4271 domain-containing protein [Winogradskyella alexanderae]
MREFVTNEWFTVFLILAFICVVIAKSLNALRFNDFIFVIGNSKYLKIYSRDQKFVDIFDGFLFVNFAVSLSIFIYLAYSNYIQTLSFDLITFLKISFAIATILIIKVLVERLVASLFEIDAIIDTYLFQKTTFKNYSGLILLISNVFLLYTVIPKNIVIIATIGLICLINLIGFFSSFKTYQNLIYVNIFYFLLYLCALEIGPYIILYKVIRDYNV